METAVAPDQGESSGSQFQELEDGFLEQVLQARPNANLDLIRRAFTRAAGAHRDQLRKSGKPYITHPIAVAEILLDLGLDDATLSAALLHDVVEDCDVKLDEIREQFGKEIASLVDGVTKLRRLDFRTRREQQAENLRKMVLAMASDIRVVVIKLADRLHNMRNLDPLNDEVKMRAIARETLAIYAPLAHRLGLQRIKWELEDLSFKYLHPAEYARVAQLVQQTRQERMAVIEEATRVLGQRLKDEGIDAQITGRPKHLYSIYNKMLKQDIDFDRIFDLTAIRVIVHTVRDCYAALGVVQNLWLPIPDMFTDFIAKPKSNRYQSLHTKVYGPSGDPMEVQIRTWDMHREAEYGIAAHWKYKEGTNDANRFEHKLSWLRQLLDLQSDVKSPDEFLESVQVDLFKEEVFVFTPNGDVVELPAESCPLDFAYRVHTEVGHRCESAKVNGRIVPLHYQFHNGDICEIVTSRNAKPSPDWLDLVRTSQAKARIKSFLRKLHFDEHYRMGRSSLEREAKSARIDFGEINRSGVLEEITSHHNYRSVDELIAAIGAGNLSAKGVVDRVRQLLKRNAGATPRPDEALLNEARQSSARRDRRHKVAVVRAEGVDDMVYRLSRCCAPLPGDDILGYVTRGRGVAVHRRCCPNVAHFIDHDPDRVLELYWSVTQKETFRATLEIEAFDRVGLLSDLTGVVSSNNLNIHSAKVSTDRKHVAKIQLAVDVQDSEAVGHVTHDLLARTDVLRVRRLPG